MQNIKYQRNRRGALWRKKNLKSLNAEKLKGGEIDEFFQYLYLSIFERLCFSSFEQGAKLGRSAFFFWEQVNRIFEKYRRGISVVHLKDILKAIHLKE